MIFQKEKPIKNTTEIFYRDYLAYPAVKYPEYLSSQYPRVLCNRQISSIAFCQSYKVHLPFLSVCVFPFTTVSPSSVDIHRHYDKKSLEEITGEKTTSKFTTHEELIISIQTTQKIEVNWDFYGKKPNKQNPKTLKKFRNKI